MNQQLIQNLVCIPRLLKTKEDSTMVSLVKESGYKSKQSESLRDELREYIECHPEFIEDWLAFSEDQRSSPAWFFTYERNGQYQLGWFATDCGISKQELFDSGAHACAEFITLFANRIESRFLVSPES